MPATATEPITGRSLVSADLFDQLAGQIVRDGHADRPTAERITDQALAFLKACAEGPGLSLRPSKAVDIGWHTFILFTREYAEFCDRIAGRFIHHVPEEFEPPENPKTTLAPTVNTMRLLRIAVDPEMWAQGNGSCSQCHAGCTECGQGGPR